MPYGTPRAGSALMLTTKTGKKNLPKKSLRQSGKFKTYITIPTKQPEVPEHSGIKKFKKLPNDHPQASEGLDKASALISTDQPHNCNIDEAPQNSSSQNLTRKVKDWRDWTYTDGSLHFFFFWWGLLHGPQQGPNRMKEKTYKTGKRKTPA